MFKNPIATIKDSADPTGRVLKYGAEATMGKRNKLQSCV